MMHIKIVIAFITCCFLYESNAQCDSIATSVYGDPFIEEQGRCLTKSAFSEAIYVAGNRNDSTLLIKFDFNGKIFHRESALRLMFGGEWFPAGRFLPIAERLGLTDKLDLAAISLALDELGRNSALEDVAVNLSAQSIQNADFRDQLRALLLSRPAVSKRLWLEIPENGAFINVDAFRAFHQNISAAGCKLGLEHFGRQFEKMSLIHDLKLFFLWAKVINVDQTSIEII